MLNFTLKVGITYKVHITKLFCSHPMGKILIWLVRQGCQIIKGYSNNSNNKNKLMLNL